MGRVKIQFHWQRPKEHPDYGARYDERSSCWVRVAYPGAGDGWGHQFIPRIGQEVVITFLEGDIDRPLVTGVVYNGRHSPPYFSGAGHLPANKTLSGIKSKEQHGGDYNELVFDDTPGEMRAKLSSEHGKTQLNQGYLIHPRTDGAGDPRGEGFELRTDRAGALRAGEGLYLTAHERRGAQGGQLDREEMIAQLEMALAIARELGEHASLHHADETDTEEQARLLRDVKQWEDGANTAKETPVQSNKAILAAAAPAGIALSSEANIHLAAGSSIDQVAARDGNLSVGQHLRLRIGQTLSIFVQNLGMKLIAAAGKIQIQAQSDEIEIGAAKKLCLYSLEAIEIVAPRVTIQGQDAGVEYGAGIVSRTTGAHVRHAGSHDMNGPASMAAQLPGMPGSGLKTDEQFVVVNSSGEPILSAEHEINSWQGELETSGGTDGSGGTETLTGQAIRKIKMLLK